LELKFLFLQVKGKDSSMPDGSASMMSMSGLSVMSDLDSNYDTMSITGRIPGKMSSVDYGRQKKK
jgi:hypothetical protein